MKKTILILMSFLLIYTSCRKDISVTPVVNYNWTTSKRLEGNLSFKTKFGKPAANAKIMIYAGSTMKTIFDGYTDNFGNLDSLLFMIGDHYSTITVVYGDEIQTLPLTDNSNKIRTISGDVTLSSYVPKEIPRADNHTYFPSQGEFGSLAFEDSWPWKGDFDFNDMVIDYNVDVKSNPSGKAISATYTLRPRGCGAGYTNGFGFQFDWLCPNCGSYVMTSDITSVKRKIIDADGKQSNEVVLTSEFGNNNSSKPTYIIIDTSMSKHYHWNTTDNTRHSNGSIIVTIEFKSNHSVSHFDLPFSNPFIYINGNRGREVHMPYHNPTAKADLSWFSKGDAAANYKSKDSLNWVIDIEDTLVYPKEKINIENAYLQFKQWATTPNSTLEWWEGTKVINNLYR